MVTIVMLQPSFAGFFVVDFLTAPQHMKAIIVRGIRSSMLPDFAAIFKKCPILWFYSILKKGIQAKPLTPD